MSKIFCPLFKNRVKDRIVFASYEDAEIALGAGNFVEETEATGPSTTGSLWDGEKFIAPTYEEVETFMEDIRLEYNKGTSE